MNATRKVACNSQVFVAVPLSLLLSAGGSYLLVGFVRHRTKNHALNVSSKSRFYSGTGNNTQIL